MPNYLDLENWSRREHFRYFRDYDNPFFNVCAEVDVTAVLERSRRSGGPSFFLMCLYLSLKAANAVKELRYRIRGDRVLVHDVVHGGSTVMRDDDTFGFGYFDYTPDFRRFHKDGLRVLEVARTGRNFEPRTGQDDLIHYSVVPWVSFMSVSHPRRWGGEDSIPKIVFGKHYAAGSARKMPVSIESHHSLVDGLHVGRFFERFQQELAAGSLD